MHIAKVSFDPVADPEDTESQVIIVRCLRQQFRPDPGVSVGEDVVLYDMKEKIEAPGVIHHVEGDIVEVAVARAQVKHLKVLNPELEPQEVAPHEIVTTRRSWRQRSMFGLLASLLAVLFSVIFYQAYELIIAAFMIESLGLTSEVNDLSRVLAPETSFYVFLGSYAWVVLWIPIIALLCSNIHWQAGGGKIIGALGSLTASATSAISFAFGFMWLAIKGIIPVSVDTTTNLTPSDADAMIWSFFISGFVVALTLSLAGAARRR